MKNLLKNLLIVFLYFLNFSIYSSQKSSESQYAWGEEKLRDDVLRVRKAAIKRATESLTMELFTEDFYNVTQVRLMQHRIDVKEFVIDRFFNQYCLQVLQDDCQARRELIDSGALGANSLQKHRTTLSKKETELLYIHNKQIIGDVCMCQELQLLFENQKAAVKNIKRLKKLLQNPGLLTEQADRLELEKAQAYDQAFSWGMLFYHTYTKRQLE